MKCKKVKRTKKSEKVGEFMNKMVTPLEQKEKQNPHLIQIFKF